MEHDIKAVTHIDNVKLSEDRSAVIIIDQTLLPNEVKYISLTNDKEMWDAINLLQVRGAPAIGICAGYCIYVLARQFDTEDYDEFLRRFREEKDYLNSSRPTAVNLRRF